MMEKSIVFIHCLIAYYTSIYYLYISIFKFNYVDEFTEFESKIKEVTNATQYEKNCGSFKRMKLQRYSVHDSFKDSCAKSLEYVKKLKLDKSSSIVPFCKYMHYWYYDMAKSNNGFPFYSSILLFFKEFENFNDCKLYMEDIDSKQYQKIADLVQMYDDFNDFKNESITKSNNECKHGDKYYTLYQKYVGGCKENHENPFCLKLIHFREYYNEHKKDVKYCTNKLQYLTPIISDLSSTILIPTAAISAMSFAFYISYKFTPLGAWLRPRLPGGKKKANKIYREMNEWKGTTELQGSQYKVPYQSS
ncbi:variable surface protein Vir9-related [Plasmodium vivax]|uniref:Variable surface protein Vir9-related n=1 Tax=Plasmodium vivax (strain Salvador I) TaxID=126793 RepID=A5KCL7_PLAVS|nr:variable surface protein Vir9-related [Plasmodium vivax]EDL42889.1 variable surface protein Vir9-related [Plasmodium vivax]|eukprot:XP_001612663.1 variable surface protein Vir9-related [Plasmodium vivax Sal-1]